MAWVILSLSFAGEPVVERPRLPDAGGAPVAATIELPWDALGYSPEEPEQAAFGPDHLALGPDGAWALWDPVLRRVHTSAGAVRADGATDLAFTPSGDLLVLDTRTRTLSRWSTGQEVARAALPGLCPTSVRLVVMEGVAWGEDAVGNLHPIVAVSGEGLGAPSGAELRDPAMRVAGHEGRLWVDGQRTPVTGVVGARAEGEWVLVDLGRPGAVHRSFFHPASGRLVAPGAPAALYVPADGVAVGPDGRIGWIDPQAHALVIHTEAP